MEFRFRLFVFLSLAFLITGIAGTLLHECGHIAVAKAQGARKVRLHYASMSSGDSDIDRALAACLEEHQTEDLSDIRKEHPCYSALKQSSRKSMLVSAGGPASNMLIGTLGFLSIAYHRRRFLSAQMLQAPQWALVLLAFFWSRQIFNFLTGVLNFSHRGRWGTGGDESHLSRHFDWPTWTLDAVTAALASIILATVVFYYIPKQQRLTFLLAGITGSALCVYLWLYLLGPVILP